MEYRPLGRTGVSVSQMCLGAMMFGAFGNPDHDESVRIVHRALDAGINFIDTADFYSAGESEEIVGKALAGGRRDDVVLATKVGLPFDGDPNHRGASRRWITTAVEGSLRRLGTDWIDLYQVHRLDPATDLDETLGALSDLVHAGKIRSFGASTVPASQIVEAQWTAERRGRERFRTEQPPYSILTRAIEYDVLPTCLRHGMGVLTWSPLSGGWLSGKYRKGQEIAAPGSPARREKFAASYDARLAGQRGQTRRRRRARRARRRGRADPRADGDRLRRPPPGGDRRRSSARGRWSTSTPTSPPMASCSPTTSSTGSTRSFRLRRRSTSRTTCGKSPSWKPRTAADEARASRRRWSAASCSTATSRSSTGGSRRSASARRGGSRIAVPGFVDLQVNGYAGVDFSAPGEDGYAVAGAALLADGVTAFQPTIVTAGARFDGRLARSGAERRSRRRGAGRSAAPTVDGAPTPRIIGAHLEGPFLSPERPGAHDPAALRAAGPRGARARCSPPARSPR